MAEAVLIDNGAGNWLLQGELDFESVPAVLQHALYQYIYQAMES